MMKKTIILLTMTFAMTLSLYATDSKIGELNKDSSIDKIETAAVVLDGEPCIVACADFCILFVPVWLPCTYTYCDSGNGGGTYLCLGVPMTAAPTPIIN